VLPRQTREEKEALMHQVDMDPDLQAVANALLDDQDFFFLVRDGVLMCNHVNNLITGN
jgi:hypothetical protein